MGSLWEASEPQVGLVLLQQTLEMWPLRPQEKQVDFQCGQFGTQWPPVQWLRVLRCCQGWLWLSGVSMGEVTKINCYCNMVEKVKSEVILEFCFDKNSDVEAQQHEQELIEGRVSH